MARLEQPVSVAQVAQPDRLEQAVWVALVVLVALAEPVVLVVQTVPMEPQAAVEPEVPQVSLDPVAQATLSLFPLETTGRQEARVLAAMVAPVVLPALRWWVRVLPELQAFLASKVLLVLWEPLVLRDPQVLMVWTVLPESMALTAWMRRLVRPGSMASTEPLVPMALLELPDNPEISDLIPLTARLARSVPMASIPV